MISGGTPIGEEPGDLTGGGFTEPYFRPEGMEHEAVNATEGPFACVEIGIGRQG